MAGNKPQTMSCYPMQRPHKVAANKTARCKRMPETPLDGQRCKRQKMSCEDQRQRNRVSVPLSRPPKAKMSIDDQKRKTMDYNVKVECSKLLKLLMDRRIAWAFNRPVDPVKTPGYSKKIKNPMDLGTIRRKLERNMYSAADEFADEVLLTFENAMKYHPASAEVNRCARLLDCNFRRRWESLAAKLKQFVEESSDQVMQPAAATAGLIKAPIAEKRGNSRRVALEKTLKL